VLVVKNPGGITFFWFLLRLIITSKKSIINIIVPFCTWNVTQKNKLSCLFVEPLNQLTQLLASFILELVLVREDRLEDGQELGCKLANGGVLPFIYSMLDLLPYSK
jgi:hypothetical protein